ncbi:hypothetical protein OG607_44835 [Streptomyces sp. NBC_01537]|uniref:hypothetical protein n=1 Tax=Streptomyces sp. NBC_01537 TaxID=2903896 RepID=UPI00386C7077
MLAPVGGVREAVGALAVRAGQAVPRPSVAEEHAASADRQIAELQGFAVIGAGPGQAGVVLQDGDRRFPAEG